ncbi:DmsE family decaheme c-type cytochrome [Nitrospirillum sp. BR 11828]|uniref:DmsE family decaheme c-type cytochrome n=1 Tax=Nitrospirillum sp. BR 11828 TaxID=3104325 RepID=UPI002ACA9CCF|nr:DmsE family decaheme c-type cytochrome [Nitrospirillum sp. BR 11828]MDZ5650121.1 DmsE family decaheme c-type cytochrome [Nitrospirillum sp. BR 11828]
MMRALFLSLLVAVAVAGPGAMPARAETPALAPDQAALRAEMARIHAGHVDADALQRIDSDIANLHTGVASMDATSTSGMTGGDLPQGHYPSLKAAQFTAPAPSGTPAGAVAETSAAGATKWTRLASYAAETPKPEAAKPEPAAAPVAAKAADKPQRTYVGRETCESCHQQEATNWAHTIHAKVFQQNPRTELQAQNCEACHGPGSAHVEDPSDLTTIISFSKKSKTPIAEQNGQCLGCHAGGQRIFWHDSVHDSNQLGCADCHNPMTTFGARGLTARESINETCFQCHKAQHAEFARRSHMPLLEGKLSCTDCHNPHGSTTAPLLKADSVNEVCFTCHADKRGPFLFEHAPVRESCLNCHSPHGSNFESLLTAPRPVLCQQCHSQFGHPSGLLTAGNMARGPGPDPRLIATSCQTCHVNIHGSNSPSGARFER